MEKNVELFLDRIIEKLDYWFIRLNLYTSPYIETGEDSIKKFRNQKLKPIIENIVKKGRGHILTYGYCYYIVFKSLSLLDYQSEMVRLFKKIDNANDKELIDIIDRYIKYLCFGDRYFYDNNSNVSEFMDDDERHLYDTCIECLQIIETTSLVAYQGHLLTEILSKVCSYCIINKQTDKLDKLLNKYFNNPRLTIERFENNGFIKENLDIADNFYDYLFKDMFNEKSPIKIK